MHVYMYECVWGRGLLRCRMPDLTFFFGACIFPQSINTYIEKGYFAHFLHPRYRTKAPGDGSERDRRSSSVMDFLRERFFFFSKQVQFMMMRKRGARGRFPHFTLVIGKKVKK